MCLISWKVRDDAQELLEKLCNSMHDIVSAKHEECHCKTTGELCCKTLLKQADRYFKLLRDKNEDLEAKRSLSQILADTLVKLEVALKWYIDLISQGNCSEVDKQFFRDRIEALKNSISRWEVTAPLFFMRKTRSTRD